MPEETKTADNTTTGLEYIGPKGVILPHKEFVELSECASRLFGILAASKEFYLSSEMIGRIKANDVNGSKFFAPISDQGFRSAIEKCANLWEYRSAQHGEFLLKPKALLSLDQARSLMDADEREVLPAIRAIHSCPVLVELPGGGIEILGRGYHLVAGGRLVSGGECR